MDYREMDYDDTVCATCGAKLPEHPADLSWQYHGFCNINCAANCKTGFDLFGRVAIDLAKTGAPHGPGFERYCVEEWAKNATTIEEFRLTRRFSRDDPAAANCPDNSWAWRVYPNPGHCADFRLTHRA